MSQNLSSAAVVIGALRVKWSDNVMLHLNIFRNFWEPFFLMDFNDKQENESINFVRMG